MQRAIGDRLEEPQKLPFQAAFEERRLAEAAFRLRAEAAESAGDGSHELGSRSSSVPSQCLPSAFPVLQESAEEEAKAASFRVRICLRTHGRVNCTVLHSLLLLGVLELLSPKLSSDVEASAYRGIEAAVEAGMAGKAISKRALVEPGYPLLLYCLVIKNPSFRKYCQRSADKVLPALLEVLNGVSTTENKILAKAPAGVMAMLLAVLALTGAARDAGFCEQMSDVKLLDARTVLGASQRSVKEISLSSLLIVVILRLAQDLAAF
eukprot:Skav235708  [mRNA]  locus=scaffold280:399899:406385:- [translate_table: standard]